MNAIRIIGRREFGDTLYSRWLIGFGLLFALLTIGVSYYGLVSARKVGFQGFELVAASLLNLILFIVPIISMAQATLNLATDGGDSLMLLLTQPVSRSEVLLGKYLGMTLAVGVALLGGLLLGGIVIGVLAGAAFLGHFLLLMGLTLLLATLFLALGTLVSVTWPQRARALGITLSLWFVFVILFDLLVFGLTIAGPGMPLRILLLGALVLNPVDAVRVTYLLATGNTAFVGATGAVLGETLSGPWGIAVLVALLLAWCLAALGLSLRIFARRDF